MGRTAELVSVRTQPISPQKMSDPFPEIKSTHSLVAKYVTKPLWEKLSRAVTATSGFTLAQAIACTVVSMLETGTLTRSSLTSSTPSSRTTMASPQTASTPAKWTSLRSGGILMGQLLFTPLVSELVAVLTGLDCLQALPRIRGLVWRTS